MKRIKYLVVFICVILVGLLLCGCGDQPDAGFPQTVDEIPKDFYNDFDAKQIYAGHFFFRSKLISVDGRTACINCHSEKRGHTSPFPDVVGGIGVGGIVTLNDNHPSVGFVDWNYHGDRDSMLIKAEGGIGGAYSPILGHSGRFGLKGKSEADKQLTKRHFNLPDDYPDYEAILHQANMALGGHELLVKKRLLSDEECLKQLEFIGLTVDEDTSADTLMLTIAKSLDAYQRSIYPLGSRYAKGALRPKELSGYYLFKRDCASCHSSVALSGGLEESFQSDLDLVNGFGKVDPSCYEDVFGDRDSTKNVHRITKKLITNLKDHHQYGVFGQYDDLRPYIEDKVESLGVVYDDAEMETMMLFLEEGLYDPELHDSWKHFAAPVLDSLNY